MQTVPELFVDNLIPTTHFACDLKRCKGACCTMPGHRGAPLLDAEVQDIEKVLPIVQSYLSSDHLKVIEREGFLQGRPGDYSTHCVDDRACVFVVWEQGIARCAFEKAFFEGKIEWRKPLSCHLFPIRIDGGRTERLRFEYLSACEPALEQGEKEDVLLVDFVRDALIRAYGEKWYREFVHYCESKREIQSV